MLTPEAIAQLKALAAKATAGPWTNNKERGMVNSECPIGASGFPLPICESPILRDDPNLALIVALRNSLDDLLVAAEAVAVMKGALEEYAKRDSWSADMKGYAICFTQQFKGDAFGGTIAQAALAKVAAKEQV